MNTPDGAESAKDRDRDEGISLPSWIDAAIAKTQSDQAAAGAGDPAFEDDVVNEAVYEGSDAVAEEAEEFDPEYETAEYEATDYETAESAGEDDGYVAEEPEDLSLRDQFGTPHSHLRLVEPAVEQPADEVYAEDEVAQEEESYESAEAATESNEPFPSFLSRRPSLFLEPNAPPEPIEASAPEPYDEMDEQRANILSEALADSEPAAETPLHADPIPLPVAPIRRRSASGPWLMAAIFFAAAAIVLAVLIWLRPLPR